MWLAGVSSALPAFSPNRRVLSLGLITVAQRFPCRRKFLLVCLIGTGAMTLRARCNQESSSYPVLPELPKSGS